MEEGTHERHSKREEETDRRYSSWKKEHMRGIPKEGKKLIGDTQKEHMSGIPISNGNASETKANESFDNGVFFYIEAKRTPSIVRKLFSKRSKHIR